MYENWLGRRLRMRKRRVIRAICEYRNPRDGKAGIGDICRALGKAGKAVDKGEVESMEETLRNEYSGYVNVVPGGGVVRVMPRAITENKRYERKAAQFRQWVFATITAVGAVLLGFVLVKYFG